MKACNCRVSSQLPLCSNALSFDLYQGCPHGCKYCFARAFMKTSEAGQNYEIAVPRSYKAVIDLINTPLKKDNLTHYYIKMKQPLHIGGMADPFPIGIEERLGHAKSFIKAIGEYPCIWSTKNPIPEYADLMKDGNHIIQCTIIGFGEIFERIEPNTPKPEERIEMLKAYKGKAKKIMVRMQPAIPWLYDEESSDAYMKKISEVADGVTVEFLKKGMNEKFEELSDIMGMDLHKEFMMFNERDGKDAIIPANIRKEYIEMFRKSAKKYGLEFYCAENEFRYMGDSPNCCGVSKEDDEIFQSKMKFNLSEFIFELREKGIIYQDEIVNRIPEEFNLTLDKLNWNAGSRKGYHEKKRRTLKKEAERWVKGKNQNNPAIFFKNVDIKREKETGRIYYQYKGD